MRVFRFAVVAAVIAGFTGIKIAAAQELDPARLLHPSVDSWPQYHGDYSGKRHSKLTQITPANVAGWGWPGHSRPTRERRSSRRRCWWMAFFTFTVPDNVWAVDARSGRMSLALQSPRLGRRAHRPSRRGDVQGTGSTSRLRMRICCRSTQRRQGALGQGDRRCRRRATGPRWRRWWCAIT